MRELWNEYRAHVARVRAAHEHDVSIAWYVENFRRHDRTKPLPNLQKLFRESRGEPLQTPSEQVHALYALSAQYGLKLTVKKKASDGQHQPDKA